MWLQQTSRKRSNQSCLRWKDNFDNYKWEYKTNANTNNEETIKSDNLQIVSNVMVVGDKRKYLTCLVTLKVNNYIARFNLRESKNLFSKWHINWAYLKQLRHMALKSNLHTRPGNNGPGHPYPDQQSRSKGVCLASELGCDTKGGSWGFPELKSINNDGNKTIFSTGKEGIFDWGTPFMLCVNFAC